MSVCTPAADAQVAQAAKRASQVAGALARFCAAYASNASGGAAAPPGAQPKQPAKRGGDTPPAKAASGKAGAHGSPHAAAWAALFADLDDRMKGRRCMLEDLPHAVALLPPRVQQVRGARRQEGAATIG